MIPRLGILAFGLAVFAVAAAPAPIHGQLSVASPDGRNAVTVATRDGRLYYSVTRDGRPLILPSLLGFEFRGAPRAQRRAPHHGLARTDAR